MRQSHTWQPLSIVSTTEWLPWLHTSWRESAVRNLHVIPSQGLSVCCGCKMNWAAAYRVALRSNQVVLVLTPSDC